MDTRVLEIQKHLTSLLAENVSLEYVGGDGINEKFRVTQIGTQGYNHLFIYSEGNRRYYPIDKESLNYLETISIYYVIPGQICKDKNFISLDVFGENGEKTYIESKLSMRHTADEIRSNRKIGSINLEEIVSNFEIEQESLIETKPFERDCITEKPILVAQKIAYQDDNGIQRKAKVLEISNLKSYLEEQKVLYQGRYLLQMCD